MLTFAWKLQNRESRDVEGTRERHRQNLTVVTWTLVCLEVGSYHKSRKSARTGV